MEQTKNMKEEVEPEISENGQADELKNIIEAAIMVSEEPLTIDRMLSMFTDATKPERATIRELLLELEQDYERRGFELNRPVKSIHHGWLGSVQVGRRVIRAHYLKHWLLLLTGSLLPVAKSKRCVGLLSVLTSSGPCRSAVGCARLGCVMYRENPHFLPPPGNSLNISTWKALTSCLRYRRSVTWIPLLLS